MAYSVLIVLVLAQISYSGSGAQADHGTSSLTTAALRNPNIIAIETAGTNVTTNFGLAPKDTIDNDVKPTDAIKYRHFDTRKIRKRKIVKRVKREEDQGIKCEGFTFNDKEMKLTHPHDRISKNKNYYNNTECVTVIEAKPGQIVKVTFLEFFNIEYHRNCSYDYLEIRDGKFGYARSLAKLCGDTFPNQYTTTGPYMWLKFYSDDTIAYEGFHMSVAFEESATSRSVPESCFMTLKGIDGEVNPKNIDEDCKKESAGKDLEVVWTIETPENTGIYLSFNDSFILAKPNECSHNILQVFTSKLEENAALAHYCGSVANSIFLAKGTDSKINSIETNIMYVRMFYSAGTAMPVFLAKYTAFRTLNFTSNEQCRSSEFSCGDNTCIDSALLCNSYPNCRLKTDEDPDKCNKVTSSILSQEGVLVILVIFCLILSGMCFVFLFKCIKKIYQDQKIINEYVKQSRIDALDTILGGSRFTLDPKMLQRDMGPRASLERDNRNNELVKQQRAKTLSGPIKPSSIDSDFIHETNPDLPEDLWRREAKGAPIEAQDIRTEKNGRTRRTAANKDASKELKDLSVEDPDTKESGCQTRESLFETGILPSTEAKTGSAANNGRGELSSTVARASTPGPNISQITIELMKPLPPQELKPQKKISDRRPMSADTTRSAPDVIIMAKPL